MLQVTNDFLKILYYKNFIFEILFNFEKTWPLFLNRRILPIFTVNYLKFYMTNF